MNSNGGNRDSLGSGGLRELVVQGVRKWFEGPGGRLEVLAGVDLSLKAGEAVAVTGPSGSGKSTLLYILGTLEPPTGGTVRINGVEPFALSEAERAAFRNENIGFVFQEHHLLPQCTVLENVLVPLLAGRGVGQQDEQRAKDLLQRVGLGERLAHRPAQLSGGERQRVALCRALINKPSLVLADEPTGNLDQRTAAVVGRLLLELSQQFGVVLVCVTHSLELAAQFPRRYQLRNGRLEEATKISA